MNSWVAVCIFKTQWNTSTFVTIPKEMQTCSPLLPYWKRPVGAGGDTAIPSKTSPASPTGGRCLFCLRPILNFVRYWSG